MSGEHTPGPWLVFDHFCGRDPEIAGDEYAAMRLVGLGQFDTIAEVRHGHDDIEGDVDANAALIAAAPEMASDGQFLIDRLHELEGASADTQEFLREFYGHVIPALARFEASVAKARGAALLADLHQVKGVGHG